MDLADTLSNARTAHLAPSTPTPTSITISPDRTFTFSIRTAPTTYLLMKAANITKGSGTPGSGGKAAGTISLKHVYEIAKVKCGDEGLGVLGLERVSKGIIGTAKTMGLEVVP
jgi:large subunit ribosomal protein L11